MEMKVKQKSLKNGDYDSSLIRLGDKPNSYPKDTGPWHRTEFVLKMISKKPMSVAAFVQVAAGHAAFGNKDNPRTTLETLHGKRVIKVDGVPIRATASEIEEFQSALHAIVEEQHPMTVRQVYYQATVHGLVEKDEKGYDKVQDRLVKMRREEKLDWEWIIDLTRERIQPLTFRDVPAALKYIARNYRKELWNDVDAYVEIWIEKEALIGIIEDITMKYDVSLMPARGYSSATFLKEAAENINDMTKPVFIYYLGDYDPSGQDAMRACEEFLEQYAPSADVTFTPLAILPEQLEDLKFAWRPTKKSDPRAAKFDSEISVELDALTPKQLRKLVENAIKKHLPPRKYKALMAQEEEEQEQIRDIIENIELDLDE